MPSTRERLATQVHSDSMTMRLRMVFKNFQADLTGHQIKSKNQKRHHTVFENYRKSQKV